MNAYSDWLEILSGIQPSPDSPLFPRIYKGDRIGAEAMVSLSRPMPYALILDIVVNLIFGA
jgi:hypothetical protein